MIVEVSPSAQLGVSLQPRSVARSGHRVGGRLGFIRLFLGKKKELWVLGLSVSERE